MVRALIGLILLACTPALCLAGSDAAMVWAAHKRKIAHVEIIGTTDFASIPRLFWSLLRPDGLYAYAAIIHDYLYWQQFLPRSKSDEVLKLCMQDFGVGAFRKWVIYFAVRLGGAGAWSDNAALKAAGEKRILKRFPEDPTTQWAQWKTRPDIY